VRRNGPTRRFRPCPLVSIPESFGSNWIFRAEDQPGATFELWIHATSGDKVPYGVHGFVRGKATISTSPPVTVDFGNLGIPHRLGRTRVGERRSGRPGEDSLTVRATL
jgi:hypothetical protein